jgi:hypothetical protein
VFGGRREDLFGMDIGAMSARGRVLAALAVLVPVGLSGVVLAFTPVWWIFTTYFWIAFPAVGLLVGGLAGVGRERSEHAEQVSPKRMETALLWALRERGELTAAGVAAETSLGVADAERMLRALAEGGHLAVRVRGGALFYSLWDEEGVPEIEGQGVDA